jgi:hypothetical protein
VGEVLRFAGDNGHREGGRDPESGSGVEEMDDLSLDEAVHLIAFLIDASGDRDPREELKSALAQGSLQFEGVFDDREPMPLPARFWQHAIVAGDEGRTPWNGTDPVTIVNWNQSAVRRQWGIPPALKTVDFFNVRGRRADIEKLWGPAASERLNNNDSAAPSLKASGGAPLKYDWESAICAVWAKIHVGDLKERREWRKYMIDWFAARHPDGGPDDSEIRKRISKIEAAFRTTDE